MFEFQLCAKADQFPVGDGWVIEEKLNGVRLALEYADGGVRGWGRGGAEFGIPSHILGSLPDLKTGTVLDGEFIYGDDERSAIGVLSRSRVPPVGRYGAFDLLHPGANESLRKRRDRLNALNSEHGWNCGSPAFVVEWMSMSPGEALSFVLRRGGEGIVMKRRDSVYSPGRHSTWLKFKKQPK